MVLQAKRQWRRLRRSRRRIGILHEACGHYSVRARARESGGAVRLDGARESGGAVRLDGARESGGAVRLDGARESGLDRVPKEWMAYKKKNGADLAKAAPFTSYYRSPHKDDYFT